MSEVWDFTQAQDWELMEEDLEGLMAFAQVSMGAAL
jgi:hypothetical protein